MLLSSRVFGKICMTFFVNITIFSTLECSWSHQQSRLPCNIPGHYKAGFRQRIPLVWYGIMVLPTVSSLIKMTLWDLWPKFLMDQMVKELSMVLELKLWVMWHGLSWTFIGSWEPWSFQYITFLRSRNNCLAPPYWIKCVPTIKKTVGSSCWKIRENDDEPGETAIDVYTNPITNLQTSTCFRYDSVKSSATSFFCFSGNHSYK